MTCVGEFEWYGADIMTPKCKSDIRRIVRLLVQASCRLRDWFPRHSEAIDFHFKLQYSRTTHTFFPNAFFCVFKYTKYDGHPVFINMLSGCHMITSCSYIVRHSSIIEISSSNLMSKERYVCGRLVHKYPCNCCIVQCIRRFSRPQKKYFSLAERSRRLR